MTIIIDGTIFGGNIDYKLIYNKELDSYNLYVNSLLVCKNISIENYKLIYQYIIRDKLNVLEINTDTQILKLNNECIK